MIKSIENILAKHEVTEEWVHEHALNDALAEVATKTLRELEQCERDMERLAVQIERDLNNMRANLEQGYQVNGAGVLQRTGVELDMLCQRHQLLAQQATSQLWALKRSAVSTV